MSALTHIVGPPVEVDGIRRQRCAWCGSMLDEIDLARCAVAVEPDHEDDPWDGPPPWPEGAQMRVDGGLRMVLSLSDEQSIVDLVDDSCALLPNELTGTQTEAVDR